MTSEKRERIEGSDASNPDVTIAWLGQLAEGEPDAVEEFWSRYGESLQRVAERQIASWLRRRVDPEDVVQSACRTFFRRAGEGSFSLSSKDDLWKLLLTITLNKVRMQARFHTRNRRSVSKERAIPEEASLQPAQWDDAIEKIELQDMLDTAFADHDDQQRQVLEMWLDGCTQVEIAKEVNCSERTVRRMQDRIRTNLAAYLKSDEDSQASSDLPQSSVSDST